jgi:diaminohydroxyphosphoribosylaminopyrimidine deaminase/5-amino-6-(5-phosphoribosylamino)uracil reductase
MSARAPQIERDLSLLDLAARGAARGHGHVEPNPMVGCVATDSCGTLIAADHHRTFGGPHAEILALAVAGDRMRGGTLYVTLEPCAHQGRTGPCTNAIIKAGPARVVIGHRDPNPEASGGIACLRNVGIEVDLIEHEPSRRLIEPFIIRCTKQRPWVTAKWAQTLDGHLATRSGQSRWISSPRSRRLVHRERGRVDAILTGIGTVLADDPRLTARAVRQRRTARRVLIDPALRIPENAALLQTLEIAPLTIACRQDTTPEQQARLRELGVDVLLMPEHEGRMDLTQFLEQLQDRHDISTVLVEAGPGLLSSLAAANCIDEAVVFIAPTLLADAHALPSLRGQVPDTIADRLALHLRQIHRRMNDVVLRYGVSTSTGSTGSAGSETGSP